MKQKMEKKKEKKKTYKQPRIKTVKLDSKNLVVTQLVTEHAEDPGVICY